ncbi:hypothetical protein [Streptomyces venezuelae]|nr:hypothetical protein [Streptomyces venezuelae]
MMSTKYFFDHPFAVKEREEGREEARAEGRAEMVLEILEARELSVPPLVRERVSACTDMDQLKAWTHRAVRVTDAADLFDGDEA